MTSTRSVHLATKIVNASKNTSYFLLPIMYVAAKPVVQIRHVPDDITLLLERCACHRVLVLFQSEMAHE
jgi:hypothetical protein